MESIEPISAELSSVGFNSVWDATTWTAFWGGMTFGCIVIYAVRAWLLSRIFKKAGVPRWKAWVPIINEFNYLKLGGRSGGNVFWGIGGFILLYMGLYAREVYVAESTAIAAAVICPVAIVLAVASLVIYVYKMIASTWNIQKKLGKAGWFIILYFINLIAPLWFWILALDKSKWNDKKGVPRIK